MLASLGNGRYFGDGILKMQSFSCSANNQKSEMAPSKWFLFFIFFPNMTNPRKIHRGAGVQFLLVRALGCKGQFLKKIRRNLLGKKSKKGLGVMWRNAAEVRLIDKI